MNIDMNINPAKQYGESHKQGKQSVEKLQRREDMLIQSLHHNEKGLQDMSPRC